MHPLKVALALAAVATASPTDLFSRTTCSTPDGSGTCLETSSCGGFSVAGYCPGASDIQCCITDTCYTPSGTGTCRDTTACGGTSVSGYCPGGSNIQCCVDGCSTPDGSGTCKDISSCSGFSVAGYCPGASNIQCCIQDICSTPSGSGTCKNTGSGCSGGSFIPGYCPGDSSVECCVSGTTTCSTPLGSGTCKSTGSGCSGGSFIAGYCPGASDIQCCVSGTTSCSTPSGSGVCKYTSSGCSGGSFIAGYCPGDSSIECCVQGSGGGGSGCINCPISRSEIISRGEYWISRQVPYSMYATYPDPEGTDYRTDCSGFVSMAIHTTPPGYSTVTLPDVATEISWDALQPGDFVGTLGAGTGGAAGHVTLFHSWVDASTKTEYNSLECRGTAYGCVAYQRPVGWTDGGFTSKPYKYIHVE